MDKEDKLRGEMKKPATEQDCKAGIAVFYVPDNRSTVYDLGRPLPLPARYRQDTEIGTGDQLKIIPAGTPVEIIQCEIGDNGEIVVGFRYGEGDGICMLSELEIIEPQ
jgi:hypothetical protein